MDLSSPLHSVSFLGLGAMGTPMAARVAERYPTRVWNRTRARADALGARTNVQIAETARECVRGARFVVTMLSDGRALEAVLTGEDGALAGLAAGAIVIDMSTIGRAAAKQADERTRAHGGRFIDAPVSGTVKPAERGELMALVGAADEDLAAARPLIDAMCSRVLHAGAVGQGQALKVVLNGVGAHHLVAFASMLALGERAGLSREALVAAFTSGAFASPSYVGKAKKVLARDYASSEFTLALTLKDTALNMQLQDEVGLALPVHREIAREIAQAIAKGLGDEDLFALEKFFAR